MKYVSAHRRISRRLGRASERTCVDCDRPALDWSYQGGDPNEINENGRIFSLDETYYVPRCRICHMQSDGRLEGNQRFLPRRTRGKCSLPDCGRPHYARGMCSMHWKRWYKRQRQIRKESS